MKLKLAQRIIVPTSSDYNRYISGKIYAIGIQGPVGAGFFIGPSYCEIGPSGVYEATLLTDSETIEFQEPDKPFDCIFILPTARGTITIDYLYEEEV